MKTAPIKTVIFDCDGTLVDSEPITNEVLATFVGQFGLDLDPAEALAQFVGREMEEIVETLQKRLVRKLPDDFTVRFRALQATALEERLRPIDGALELLQSLRIPISLASNAPHPKIEINLRVTGLAHFFPKDRLFSAYDINAWKPQPDLFLYAAEQTGFEPQHCAVVEDSPAGVEAAIRAGMQVFCYDPNGRLELPERFRSCQTKVCTIRHLSELGALVAPRTGRR